MQQGKVQQDAWAIVVSSYSKRLRNYWQAASPRIVGQMMNDTISVNEALEQIELLKADILKANKRSRQWGLVRARRERLYRQEKAGKWADAKLSGEIKQNKL